jgi:transcriptional regulator with XRE-family HTH domain
LPGSQSALDSMSASQCRMARAGIGWTVRELAAAAKMSADTIVRFETGQTLRPRTVDAIRATLEAAGVEFTNGDAPGVRLRKTRRKRTRAIDGLAQAEKERGVLPTHRPVPVKAGRSAPKARPRK